MTTQKEEKFKQQVEKLMAYIEERQQYTDNGWVIITHRDVPEITGFSQYYTSHAFEALKNHDRVAFRIAEINKPNKPFEFKVVADLKEKKEHTVTGRQFRYLEDEEVKTVKELLKEVDDFGHLMLHMRILDYLCLQGAKKKPVPFELEKLCQYFVIDKYSVEDVWLNLLDKEILVDHGDLYTFNVELLSKDDENLSEKIEDKGFTKSNDSSMIHEEIPSQEDPRDHDSQTENGTTVGKLAEHLKGMAEVQEQFKQFFDEKVEQLLTHQEEKGYEALQKLTEENDRLQRENERLAEENQILTRSLEKKEQEKQDFIAQSQSRLEILSAEIHNAISQYVSTPAWQKGPQENAHLQSRITKSITSAIDDILYQGSERR